MPPPLVPRAVLDSPATPVLARQASTTTATIPALYGSIDSSPDPGAVAGITLGAVGGFVLVLYLIYICINMGNPSENAESSVPGSVVLERKSHHHHSSAHHHHRRSRGEATVEVRRTSRAVPAAVIVEERVSGGGGPGGRIIVEEARRREASRGPRIVDVGSDEDEVVVIEEHSPPPRRRRSRVRSVERRSAAYSRRDSSSRG